MFCQMRNFVQITNFCVTIPLESMKIEDETKDLDYREKALIAKETQQVEEELDLVKSKLETVIQEFENQLRTAEIDQYGSLIKKAESAIGSLVESHRPMSVSGYEDFEVLRTPQPGEQVHVKRLAGKLATVVEVSEDDETVLIQYGKVRFRVDKSGIQHVQGLAAGSGLHLKKQVCCALYYICSLSKFFTYQLQILFSQELSSTMGKGMHFLLGSNSDRAVIVMFNILFIVY